MIVSTGLSKVKKALNYSHSHSLFLSVSMLLSDQ